VITGRRADVNLCVVGVRMGCKPIRKDHVEQFGRVQHYVEITCVIST